MLCRYAKDRMRSGPVFGNMDFYQGLSVVIDTYSNHNGEHNVSPFFILYVNIPSKYLDLVMQPLSRLCLFLVPIIAPTNLTRPRRPSVCLPILLNLVSIYLLPPQQAVFVPLLCYLTLTSSRMTLIHILVGTL